MVMEGAILSAVAFSILPEILSGPFDFETSIDCRSCATLPHYMLSGHSSGVIKPRQSWLVSGEVLC